MRCEARPTVAAAIDGKKAATIDRPRGGDLTGQYSSLWATVQRRWVWIDGCVAQPGQIPQIEQLLRQIDDVEGVVVRVTPGSR